MTYQEYKTQFYAKRQSEFSSKPMDEKSFNEMMGIKEDSFHEPFVARKSSSHKNTKLTLNAHIETTKKSQEENQPRLKNTDLIKVLDNRIKKPRKSRAKSLNPLNKTSLKNMSDEEKRKHKNEVKKKSYAKRKELGLLPVRTPKQIENERAYARQYYQDNKEVETQKRKDYRASLSEDKKEALKAKMRQWQADNRELVNQRAREWKKQRREKLKNAS